MLQSLTAYVPMDRRHALARGHPLPERVRGAALFADISGFVPLAEELVRALGPRQGADELTVRLNRVYDAVIAEADRYRGSVIGFAGDAITCWFDDQGTGNGEQEADAVAPPSPFPAAALRATACAMAMQQAIAPFAPELTIKVAVASGPARRFLVGDPQIQCFDALAGETLARMAAGERLAGRGEVAVDRATASALGDAVAIEEWRAAETTGDRYAVVAGLGEPVAPAPWPALDEAALAPEVVSGWLLPAVYSRLAAGLGEFLTELRPTIALFLRFAGIDYEGDPDAGHKLNAFVCRVQRVLAGYESALIDLTIGDKGNYLYAAFGAPVAHEDDARRAASAALDLQQAAVELDYIGPLQIGVTQGMLRAGAYGGATRRTYSVLGDDVNLAARLMQAAVPGTTLVSGRVQKALGDAFVLEPLPPVLVKGKREPVTVFELRGARPQHPLPLQAAAYGLPLVGRKAELALLAARLDLAVRGRGQIVGITAEAGMGKSRLVAEVIRLARERGLAGYGGECQSYGTHSSYLVWSTIWQAFFGVDPSAAPAAQAGALERAVTALAPARAQAQPLLGPVLNLPLPDNDFTRGLEPQDRKTAAESLLLDCLRARARARPAADPGGTPLLLVLEDVHWIDPASLDLLEAIAHAVADLPVLVMLAYRPLESVPDALRRIERLPHFTRVSLAELDETEVEQLIRAKLAQSMPEHGGRVPAALIARITARAQGNPFYAEELLNYVRDRGLDPHDAAALELPDSLQRLILSRIDQLDDRQRIVLKVASVIGRLFRFSWLHGYYPALGTPEAVKAELAGLARLDLTPLDQPEPEPAYLFKHVVTQEVTYASMGQAMREDLHERLARYLEGLGAERHLDLLAYHYARSANTAKTREYLRRAGDAAAARFANVEAIEYLSRALDLAPEDEAVARYELLLAREQVFALQGASEGQALDLAALAVCAETLAGDARRAEVAVRQARYLYQRAGDYPAAIAAAERGLALAEATGAGRLAAEAHVWSAWALAASGDPQAARVHAEASLDRARAAGDLQGEARALNCLGNIAREERDLGGARARYMEVLEHARALGDRSLEGAALNNLGSVAYDEGNYAACRAYTEQSLIINREIGRRRIEATVLGNLGELALAYGDAAAARADLEGSLALFRQLDHRAGEGWVMANLGLVAARKGDLAAAREYGEEGVRLLRQAGERTWEASALTVLGDVYLEAGRKDKAAAAYRRAVELREQVGETDRAAEPLAGLARVALAHGDVAEARARITPVVAALEAGALDAADDPLGVHLACWQVLHAAGDLRAAQVLRRGYELLQARAAKIDDARMRRMYLEAVPHHREIAEAWRSYGR